MRYRHFKWPDNLCNLWEISGAVEGLLVYNRFALRICISYMPWQ